MVHIAAKSCGDVYYCKSDKCKSLKQEKYKVVEELLANLVSPYNPSHGDGTIKELSRELVIKNNNQASSSRKKTTSIFIGISIDNSPFWGIPIFGNNHISWLVFNPIQYVIL